MHKNLVCACTSVNFGAKACRSHEKANGISEGTHPKLGKSNEGKGRAEVLYFFYMCKHARIFP